MTNIASSSSAFNPTVIVPAISQEPEAAAQESRPFIARTRAYGKVVIGAIGAHLRYACSSAEVTQQNGFSMSNTENADANGKNGDTTTDGLSRSKARTGSSKNYGGKSPNVGNGAGDVKCAERNTGTSQATTRTSDSSKKAAHTRLTARLRALSRSVAKAVTKRFVSGEACNISSSSQNANSGAPAADPLAVHTEPSDSPEFRPARNVKDFAKGLRDAFPGLKFEPVSTVASPGRIDPNAPTINHLFRPRTADRPSALEEQHERDLAELSTRLDKFKGLMPGCSYMYALQLVDALSDGCYGDPRLAIKVLDEMERIRVASGADGAKHDPRKAALDCMSRLGSWLEFNKPKLYVPLKTGKDGYRSTQKTFTKIECEQAFTRTAALLSDTHHTRHAFDALCLATGMMSPHALRAERDQEDACGSAGHHRLDLRHPDIGKRLVLTRLQALNHDNGDARDTHLATRVIAHTSKLAQILKNQKLLDSLPRPPAHARFPSPNFGTDQQTRLELLRAHYKAEHAALEQQIDMLIYGNEKIGLDGIGEAAFVDLSCWFNDMHTDADVNRLGEMSKEFAKDYQVCEAIAKRPILEKLGPVRHLVEGSSALYARHQLGRGVAGRRHGDEDHKEGVDTAGDMLRVIATELQRVAPEDDNDALLAAQVCHLLLTAGCGLSPNATAPERIAALRAALQKLSYPVTGGATAHAIALYCQIFAPELTDHPPETLEALSIRQDLANTKLGHTRREQLGQQLERLIEHRAIAPNLRPGLRGKQQKLDIINGNAIRSSATIEAVCNARQYDHLYAQDNSETISDGVSATVNASVEVPLTPDGQLKFSNTNQSSTRIAKTMQVNRENHGNQMATSTEISRGGKITFGLGVGEKFGMGAAGGELTASGEVSRAEEMSRLVGCQITVLRHALSFVDDSGKEIELARANYEGVGEFGEFRVLSSKIEAFHAGSARNPEGLTPEQLLAQYPEHLRPQVKLSKNDREIKPFTGKTLSAEECRAQRDPRRESKLAEMSGRAYLSRFFLEFRHYDHAIAITENQRKAKSTKYNASLGLRLKTSLSGVGQVDARANLISHTAGHETSSRRDVKGSLLFETVMYTTAHSTHTGISVDTTTGKGVISDDETAGRRGAYNRKLGETLESQLIKLTTKEGETNAFYSYCGHNFTNFDEFKRAVDKDPRAWGALLRETTLPKLPDETDEDHRQRQENLDRATLDAKLAFLKETKPGQNKRILIRLRMRESTAVRLDQIRCEIHHTEATVCQTIDRLERLKRGSGPGATAEMRADLQAKLAKLEHTLDKLYAEKVHLLTNAANWSPFGLGTGEVASKSESSAIPVRIATKYLTVGSEIASVQRFAEYYETAWVKENARASDDSHRLGRTLDLKAMEQRHLASLLQETSPQILADDVGGLIRTGVSAEDLGGNSRTAAPEHTSASTRNGISAEDQVNLAQHIDDVLRNRSPRQAEPDGEPHPAIEVMHPASAPAANAERIALAEARATLCRHLLTLERADLVESLVNDGIVTLQTILEQAVKSKRISLVEWVLDLHKTEMQSATPGVWNLPAALGNMQQNDRHELLYGLMVRDWEKDRAHRQHDSHAYQGRLGSYAATAWQGRTEAAWRETRNAPEHPAAEAPQAARATRRTRRHAGRRPAAQAAPTPPRDDASTGTQTIGRDTRGLLVDWLVRHDHINRTDILELMRYRPNPRTIDFAVTHAHGKALPERGQYSIGKVINSLKWDHSEKSPLHLSNQQIFLKAQALAHPDVDVAVQLGAALREDNHVSPYELLARAIQERDTARVNELVERGYIKFDLRGIKALRIKLESNGLTTLLAMLEGKHAIAMLTGMHPEADSAEAIFLTALRERNMAGVRELIDTGHITHKMLAEMQAHGTFTADDVRHLLDLYEGRHFLTMVRTLHPSRSTRAFLHQALVTPDTKFVQKLMAATSLNVERVLNLYREQTLSQNKMDYLLSHLHGQPYLALAAGVYGSVPLFLQQAVHAGSTADVHKLMDTPGMDLNAAISELQQAGPFGRRYLAKLAHLLGEERQARLATPHVATLLEYGLDPNAPGDLFRTVAGMFCARLRANAPEERLDLTAVLGRARPTAQTLHRLLRMLERHGQLDNTTRDALLRFCCESSAPCAAALFQVLRTYHFRSGHPLQISTAQITTALEHVLHANAPEGLMDVIGDAVCARLQAGQPDGHPGQIAPLAPLYPADLVALLGRAQPDADHIAQLLAKLDRHRKLDEPMLEQLFTFALKHPTGTYSAPYMALCGYRDGDNRPLMIQGKTLIGWNLPGAVETPSATDDNLAAQPAPVLPQRAEEAVMPQ